MEIALWRILERQKLRCYNWIMKIDPCSLASLTDEELLLNVKALAARERESTAQLIASLVELDARRLYFGEGFPSLRDFLKQNKIEHVLLIGYATDMCFCKTTAGYENLSKDFNVFLVGDATLATFPANNTPKYATNAHISFAALNHLITQTSWIQIRMDANNSASK